MPERCGKTITHHQIPPEDPSSFERKPNKALLHFGLDYLVLLLGIENKNAASLRLINAIFSLPHNDTNAAEYRGFGWADTGEDVTVRFSQYQQDEVAYVFRAEDHLFSIQKIGLKSTMPPSVKERYRYRISFYGWFFSLVRLGHINIYDYWNIFLRDIEEERLIHSVSRIDICADIGNLSVRQVQRSIVRLMPRGKKFSELEKDNETRTPETVYFGGTSRDWKGRIYNKLIEIFKKGKERLYPQYSSYSLVTRVEIELHSRPCQTFSVNLQSVLSLEHLLMVFKAHLRNKNTSWGILRFIEKTLQEQGFKAAPLERKHFEYEQMPSQKFFKVTCKKVSTCAKRFGVDIKILLHWIDKAIEDSSKSNA